jgi:hypothetical protein
MGIRVWFLKQVAVWKRAEEAREQRTGGVGASQIPTGFLLESPQVPATYKPHNAPLSSPFQS